MTWLVSLIGMKVPFLGATGPLSLLLPDRQQIDPHFRWSRIAPPIGALPAYRLGPAPSSQSDSKGPCTFAASPRVSPVHRHTHRKRRSARILFDMRLWR